LEKQNLSSPEDLLMKNMTHLLILDTLIGFFYIFVWFINIFHRRSKRVKRVKKAVGQWSKVKTFGQAQSGPVNDNTAASYLYFVQVHRESQNVTDQ
jgi:hypothetical protein